MDTSVLAHNLRRIRSAKGLNQTQLADLAGLSRVAYRNIETGTAVPKLDSLLRIARALDLPVEELLVPRRSLTAVRFRANKKMTIREQLLVDLARWLDDYNEVERLVSDRQQFTLSKLASSLQQLSPGRERAQKAALEARGELGLRDDEMIRDVYGLLEERGGVKTYAPVVASEGFFGLSVAKDDGGPAIVVNVWDRIPVERWIFSAIHELGHLLLHLHAYDVTKTEEDEREEEEANIFASHFLMPDAVFKKEWKETQGLPLVIRVLKVKQMFRVSYKTVLYRIHETIPSTPGYSSVWQRFHIEFHRHYKRSLKQTDEPAALHPNTFGAAEGHSANEPERLSTMLFMGDRRCRLVCRAIAQGKLSTEQGAKILGTTIAEMNERLDSQQADN